MDRVAEWLVPWVIRSVSLRSSIPGGSVDGAVPGQPTVNGTDALPTPTALSPGIAKFRARYVG